jgi:hypothetical protein
MVNGNGTIVGNLRSERGIASFYKSKSNKGHFKATINQKMERCHGQRQREESIKRWQGQWQWATAWSSFDHGRLQFKERIKKEA